MELSGFIEEWPDKSILFLHELPGCFAAAPTSEAVLQVAPVAIARYMTWLKKNGLAVIEDDGRPATIVVKECLQGQGSSIGPLFQIDQVAPGELEIDLALNVAATARALIIEIVANLPEPRHKQSPASGAWSLHDHLLHVMEKDNWFVTRLQEQPALLDHSASLSTDEIAMKIFENAMDNELLLRDILDTQATRIFQHDGQAWTIAKVFRRQTSHLYEHLLAMEALEAQLSAQRT
jgi:hypothetical protein